MASTTLPLLAAASSAADADIFLIRKSGETTDKKLTGTLLKAYAQSGLGTMANASTSDYYTKTAADALLANKQPLDTTLTNFAALSIAANKLPYGNGSDTFALADFTAFGRSLVDDADATAGRSTLGLGSIATQAASNVAITGGSITNTSVTGLSAPTNGSDAVTKDYVDALTAGMSQKNAVRMTTTGALTATYANGASGVGATLTNSGALVAFASDGVSGVLGDRVLVKNQAAPAQNGMYTLTTVGSGAVAWVLTRATDYDTASEVSEGSYTVVEEGTTNAGTLWIETGSGPFTIGTTSISFTQLSVAPQTLTFTGDVTGTGSSSIALTIANDAVTYAKMQNVSATDRVLGRSTAGAGDVEEITFTSFARQLADDTSFSAMRTTLGLAIGTDVQAQNATLQAIAGATFANDKGIYFTGASAVAAYDLTAGGRALGGVAGTANTFPYFSASNVASLASVTAYARSILDDADAATARATLGIDASLVGRNAVMNPDFTIWQRKQTTFTSIANNTSHSDRWKYQKSGAMVHDISRSTDVPTQAQAGVFSFYSLLVDCTTVDSSIAAGDYCAVLQTIEGFDFIPFAQRALTLGFWAKHTKTGIYCVAASNSASDRSFVAEYTINVTDTWEFKAIAITASPSAGTWNYTTGAGLILYFTLAAGSTFQTTAGAWQTGNFLATANQVNGCDSTANNFRLALVKLEAGTTATPFMSPSFGDELARCERFYEKSFEYATTPAVGLIASTAGAVREFTSNRTDRFGIGWTKPFRRRKRVSPTVTIYGNAATARVYDAGGGADRAIIATASETSVSVDGDVAVTTSANSVHAWQFEADSEF